MHLNAIFILCLGLIKATKIDQEEVAVIDVGALGGFEKHSEESEKAVVGDAFVEKKGEGCPRQGRKPDRSRNVWEDASSFGGWSDNCHRPCPPRPCEPSSSSSDSEELRPIWPGEECSEEKPRCETGRPPRCPPPRDCFEPECPIPLPIVDDSSSSSSDECPKPEPPCRPKPCKEELACRNGAPKKEHPKKEHHKKEHHKKEHHKKEHKKEKPCKKEHKKEHHKKEKPSKKEHHKKERCDKKN